MRPIVRGWLCFVLILISLAATMPAAAQIPRDEYLRYVPLTYPRIIRQTEASARFHLYGDAGDPSYRDVDPKDGIDDGRAKWLNTLATRFAPIMIRNTPQFPMDFRVFYRRDSFSIFLPSNERAKVRGDFHQDEYHGALRFNLMTGSFQPYVKYGHGLTYYRLKNVNVNGKLISQPTSPKFRPAGRWLDFGFNETILGGGVDWSDIRVGKIWIGAKASYTFMHHNIGFERLAAVEDFPFIGTIVAGTKYSIWRQQARFFFNVSW